MKKFLFLNLHQHDIRSDLPDARKRNDIFTFRSEKSPYFPRTRNDHGFDLPRADIKLQIYNTPESLAVTDIDHFFFPEFAQTHSLCSCFPFLSEYEPPKSFVTVLSELFFPNCFFPNLSPFLSLSNPLQYYQDEIPTDLIFQKKKRSIFIYERNDFIIQSYK